MGRRSYSGLMALPVWAVYDEDQKLAGTVRAAELLDAAQVFTAHNERHPEHAIRGSLVKL